MALVGIDEAYFLPAEAGVTEGFSEEFFVTPTLVGIKGEFIL